MDDQVAGNPPLEEPHQQEHYGGAAAADPAAAAAEQGGNDEVIGSAAIRPAFLGNLKQSCTTNDIVSIFERPLVTLNCPAGTVRPIAIDRIDMKRGYCFVFLKDATRESDKEQAERYVSDLNGMEVENVSNTMRAEFARGDGRIKRKEDDRRKNIQPSETLFVVNFSEETTKREDLQMLFEPYGELVRIDMKRNYAFVQFRTIEEAIRAKDVTDGGKLDQSVLTVEFVARQRTDDRGRRGGGGGRRDYDRDGRGRYDRRGGYDRRYNDRGRDLDRDRYDDRGGRHARGRSPGGYRGSSPGGARGGSPGAYRGSSPPRYRGRSRSRSRSPRYGYRKRSPPRGGNRYDDRGRHDDYRDNDRRGGNDYSRETRRSSPDRDGYRAGRDDRGYRS